MKIRKNINFDSNNNNKLIGINTINFYNNIKN